MRSAVGFSLKSKKEVAFEEVCAQIKSCGIEPKIVFFFSDYTNFSFFAEKMNDYFPLAVTIGSTSYIDFTSVGCSHFGLSALAVYEGVECSCGVLHEIDRHPLKYIDSIKRVVSELSSTENTCCIEFCSAFTNGEELALDTFQEGFEGLNISVVGSSSGSSEETFATAVALNGKVYKDSCVFALVHNLNGRIFLFRENVFKPTQYTFSATDVDCEKRIVYEYDGKPAEETLKGALKLEGSELHSYLATHPMGRIIDGKIYITELNSILDDGAISYFGRIYSHTKMVLLEADDFNTAWNQNSEKIRQTVPNPSFALAINCLSRSKLFEQQNKFDDFLNYVKRNVPIFVGVSGYGEQMGHGHLNQSFILIVFE